MSKLETEISFLTKQILTRTCQIFEQSRFANETGAAIHLAPNCNGLLRKLGLKGEDIGANSTRVVRVSRGHYVNVELWLT